MITGAGKVLLRITLMTTQPSTSVITADERTVRVVKHIRIMTLSMMPDTFRDQFCPGFSYDLSSLALNIESE